MRLAAFLAAVALLAWLTFRVLAAGEVERVVAVHVMDKAAHLVDMLEANGHTASNHQNKTYTPSDDLDFFAMANAIRVASIYFLDHDSTILDRWSTVDVLGAESSRSGATSHASNMSHDTDSHSHSHAHAHPVGNGGPTSKQRLANTQVPAPAALLDVAAGKSPSFIRMNSLQNADQTVIHFAHVVLPVHLATDERIATVGFVFDVSHIYTAYAHGIANFGMLFMFCGIVLFGVPSFGFWLQKRLAETSSRDARYLSRHDALTGLLNRSAFVSEVDAMLARNYVGFVAYIDADRFKLINDTYGHSVGDMFLRHIADVLRAECGPDALHARLGGDEFVFALPRMTDEMAQNKISNVMRRTAEDVELDGFTLSTSISMGIAEQRAGDTLDKLLQRADTALYSAKCDGRNKAAFYQDDMGAAAQRRRLLEARLRDACRDGDFEIFYQPLVSAQSLETIGYEALLRLTHSDGSAVSPSEFIPLAEEIGLIEEIGTWVLRKATKEISALDNHTSVSINLSPEQFRSGNLVKLVSEALDATGLSADRLELEVTESILMEEDNGTEYQIDALKDLGVSIAMDDFGTGFSSLSTLWRYGFDRIKIDKTFVQALVESPDKPLQLIDAIVMLGGRMNMSITAEGIENEQQREILTEIGCDVLQGYLFGRPEPLENHNLPKAKLGATKASR